MKLQHDKTALQMCWWF